VAVPVGVFVVGWWWHDGPLWDALILSTAFATALLLGAYLQTRRAYLAELEERARRLEHEREQQDRLAVAAERARIAREMHDIVAHNLAVMVALADGAAAVTPGTPLRGVDMMRQTALTGRQALTEIRRLIGLLRVSEEDGRLAPQPGLDDLDELVGQVRAAGLAVTLTRTGTCAGLGPGAELAIYRIVQEALTNTIKHAGQHATAQVRLSCDGTEADVEITDDGGDRVTAPARPGHGLTGMTERAASYGGRVEAGPDAARGWRVHAHLGLDAR
jgi:signal transduction histidine kinase